MIDLTKFIAYLYSGNLLIEPSAGFALEMAFCRLLEGAQLGNTPYQQYVQQRLDIKSEPPLTRLSPTTARIDIAGPIGRNLDFFTKFFMGACDLNDVLSAIEIAKDDGKIKKVALNIDSPGGGYPGVPEVVAAIKDLRETKMVGAWVERMGASAAYYILSAADEVVVAPSAQVGSIGVYQTVADFSEYYKKMGINIELITAGKLKAMGSGVQPLSKDQRSHLQDGVNSLHDAFKSSVLSSRPDVAKTAMEGQTFMGQAAVDAGLADGLANTQNEYVRMLWAA